MPRQILNRVTVTGVDDSTSLKALKEISAEFPFVEWGVLLSRKQTPETSRMECGRWASKEKIRQIVTEFKGKDIMFAGHVCGSWVREIFTDKWPKDEFTAIHEDLYRFFGRYQLNTHAEPHAFEASQLIWNIHDLGVGRQSVIFQYDGVNTHILNEVRDISNMVKTSCFNINSLFDLSHGAGVLPKMWPRPIPGIYCGYAGGLTPENVDEQLSKIETIVDLSPIWIDIETHVRSKYENNDSDEQKYTVDYLDMNKVHKHLTNVKPWVWTRKGE